MQVVEQALAFPGAPFAIVIARSAGLSEGEGVDCGSAPGTLVPIVNPIRWQLIENRAMLLLDV